MIYLWLKSWVHDVSVLNIFHYITFRSFLALFTSLVIFLIFGGPWIRCLRQKKMGQSVRNDGPESHLTKSGTPTMGGLLILLAWALSVVLWADVRSPLVLGAFAVCILLGVTGFWDDYQKIVQRNSKGLRGKYKLLLQAVAAATAFYMIYNQGAVEMSLQVPFFKEVNPDLGYALAILVFLVIAGASNAVNLTDGLDGLVSGPLIIAFTTMGLLAYLGGHAEIADYLQIRFVPGAGELAILCAAAVGGLMGFLWFNAYPAQIFMGDVGALSLGGLLGYVALVTKQEILLIAIGGIFVVEAISVIAQVGSFKLTGKRIFRMAPIHHHFELKGWAEPKIIVRFWIIAFILALLSLTTLKIR